MSPDPSSQPIAASPAPCADAELCPISDNPCPGRCVFADVLGSASVGIVVFDLERRAILFCNRWARKLLDRAEVPVDFDRLGTLLLPPRRKRPGAVVQPEPLRVGSRSFGHTVYYGRGVAWVFLSDITEKERLAAIAEAVETTKTLGHVFLAVRHELGNPINSIKTALSVLQTYFSSCSRETIADYVDRMLLEVARIERLLRSLRSFAAIERLQIEPFALDEICVDCVELVQPVLDERGIRLTANVDPSLCVLCDPRAMRQPLLNVVTNASDALAGRGDARIELRCSAADGVVQIQVEDNGAGISPEQQAHLFEPFSTTKPDRTGLGLVIVRKLLAAMNGTIAIESVEGRGTVVTLSLPSAEPPCSTGLTTPFGLTRSI